MLEGTIGSTERLSGRTEIGKARTDRADPEPRRRDLLARLSAMSLAGFGRRIDGDRDAVTEATAVARAWLALIDDGGAAVSWAAAAPALRETIGPEEWEVALRSVRAPLGACHSRRLVGRTTVEAFSGIPSGPYAVAHFEGAFEGRHGVIETVTTCLGDDGRWRVAAYFMR